MAQEFEKIGFIKKPFGIQGALKVSVEDRYLEDLLQTQVVFVEIQGKPVPYFIENLSTGPGLILKLEEVDSRDAASGLATKQLFLQSADVLPDEERQFDPPEGLLYEGYTGYRMIDKKKGPVGIIAEVREFPQQEMAIVQTGEKEFFIPMAEALIVRIDQHRKEIHVDLPEGLLDL